jgi:hypothetical protein
VGGEEVEELTRVERPSRGVELVGKDEVVGLTVETCERRAS